MRRAAGAGSRGRARAHCASGPSSASLCHSRLGDRPTAAMIARRRRRRNFALPTRAVSASRMRVTPEARDGPVRHEHVREHAEAPASFGILLLFVNEQSSCAIRLIIFSRSITRVYPRGRSGVARLVGWLQVLLDAASCTCFLAARWRHTPMPRICPPSSLRLARGRLVLTRMAAAPCNLTRPTGTAAWGSRCVWPCRRRR